MAKYHVSLQYEVEAETVTEALERSLAGLGELDGVDIYLRSEPSSVPPVQPEV